MTTPPKKRAKTTKRCGATSNANLGEDSATAHHCSLPIGHKGRHLCGEYIWNIAPCGFTWPNRKKGKAK